MNTETEAYVTCVDCKRYKYMLDWRNKEIKLLREQIEQYESTIKLCLSLIGAVCCENENTVSLEKKKIEIAVKKKYTVEFDDKCYYIKCLE